MGKKNIFKSTLIYFAGNVSTKIITFFMLPLYTKFIPAADMGTYDSAIAIATFFASVLFLDIGSGIMRFMFEKQEEVDGKKTAIYTGLAIFLCSLSLYLIVAVVAGLTFPFEYFVWIALYGFLLTVNTVYGYVARGYGYNLLYAASGIASTLVNVGCNLLFILVLKWDYVSLYIAQCAAMLIHILILECKCKILIGFRPRFFDKQLFKTMVRFSLPLCVNSVAFWLLNSANKVIVVSFLGAEFNGYLAIANKFTSILYLVSSCFQLAWQELAFSKDNNDLQSVGRFYTKAFDLYLRLLMVGLLLLIPLIRLGLTIYPNFIDQSYADAVTLIPLALAGAVMSIASSFLGSIFGGIKKNGIIFISTLVGAIVNIGTIFLLLNPLGASAANVAFLLGFTSAVLVRTLVLRKAIGLKVRYWYFLIAIPVYLGVAYAFDRLNWVYNLLILLALLLGACFVMKNEIKLIWYKSRNKRSKNND